MKKKLICFVLIVVLFVGTVPVFGSSTSSSDDIPDMNIWVADKLITSKDESEIICEKILRDDKPSYAVMAENYIENKPQYYLTNAWSNFLNEDYRHNFYRKQEFVYDMVLMGFLKNNCKNDGEDSLSAKTKDFTIKLYSLISEDPSKEVVENGVLSHLSEKQTTETAMKLWNNANVINNLNIAIKELDDGTKAAKRLIEELSRYLIIAEARDERIKLLEASKKYAEEKKDTAYIKAVDNIISAFYSTDIKPYVQERSSKVAIELFLTMAEDKLKDKFPVLKEVELSLTGMDAIFDSNDRASNDVKLAYFYLTDSYLKKAVYDLWEQYNESEKTSLEADSFINGFSEYVGFQKYGINYSAEWLDLYIKDIDNGSFFHKLINGKKRNEAINLLNRCNAELSEREEIHEGITALYVDYSKQFLGIDIDDLNSYTYQNVIEDLTSQYGHFRMTSSNHFTYPTENGKEANGVCYLNLLDFNRDNSDELIAVCKNDEEYNYTCYVYTMKDGQAKCVFHHDNITYRASHETDTLDIAWNDQYGYVITTGYSDTDDNYSYVYAFNGDEFSRVKSFIDIWWYLDSGDDFTVIDDKVVSPDEFFSTAEKFWSDESENYDIVLRTEFFDSADEKKITSILQDSINEVSKQLDIDLSNLAQKTNSSGEVDYKLYNSVYSNLVKRYGNLRVSKDVYSDNEDVWEFNGVCGLQLIDFNGDEIFEMLALCKREYEYKYHAFIYSIVNGYVECVYYIDNLYFSFVEGKSALCIVNSPQNEYALLAGGESEDSSSYRYYGYKDKAYTKIDDIFCYLDSGNYYVNNHESDYEEYMGIVNHWTIQEPVIYIQSNNDDLDTRMANSLIDDTLKDINRVSEKAATGGKGAFGSGAGGGSR